MTNSSLGNSTVTGQLGKLLTSYYGSLKNKDPLAPTDTTYLKPKGVKNPITAYEKTNPFADWATFGRAQNQDWATQTLAPEFERMTLNPFMRQYANAAASSYMGLQGNAQDVYNRNLDTTTQPFMNQVAQARDKSEGDLLARYNIMRDEYYKKFNIIPPSLG